jgi:mannose-1-phosphate guanylyltransferase/mannose-1-phosphate guanylyltransferase/mannose-6-phosphate isomerase
LQNQNFTGGACHHHSHYFIQIIQESIMIPVILAGGTGSRLWPLSRVLYPKQFIPLVSENSMLQETLQRLLPMGKCEPVMVCNEAHRFMVAEQCRQIGVKPSAILLEPAVRNTAPAIALAALEVQANRNDDVMLVLPADHVMDASDPLYATFRKGMEIAADGYLVTFGIVPRKPETGYGYIHMGAKRDGGGFEVDQFVEKPDPQQAKAYVSEGDYLWNSGMFMFRASAYLTELKRHQPEIFSACEKAMQNISRDIDFTRVDEKAFSSCPENSIDYAVMEKTDKAVVLPLDVDWSDVGSWSALWDIAEKDEAGNACHGDVITHDCVNTYIRSEKKLVAALGVEELVIIESDDAFMVAQKDRVQEVKTIIGKLKEKGRSEFKIHRQVFRPWGNYDSVDQGERFQVKRITVLPGQKLSLQKHHHRAEHWIVVKGTAMITNGDQQIMLSENQSTYIPLGTLHQLENPGVIPLELVEVQSGTYLGEDDIVRFEDIYGRQ